MASVDLQSVTKQFRGASGERVTAVENLTFSVATGELLVLAGPSGSGKTTTLRLLAGLEEPSSGTVRVNGQILNGVDPRHRDVAMVFQNQALYPHMTAHQNIAFGLELRKVGHTEIEQRVRETAELLGIVPCLTRRPEELSGGERQRVALGRALARRPALLLLDEPLSNLDLPLRLQLRAEIARLHSTLPMTTIYVTHDQAEAMALGDRLAVLKQGSLQQLAPPMEIYRRPATLSVARFIGSPPMNLVPGKVTANPDEIVFRTGDSGAEASANASTNNFEFRLNPALRAAVEPVLSRPVLVGFRPEHFRWTDASGSVSQAATFEAMAEVVEHVGPDTYVHLRIGGVTAIGRAPGDLKLRVNERARGWIDLDQALFFEAETGRLLV